MESSAALAVAFTFLYRTSPIWLFILKTLIRTLLWCTIANIKITRFFISFAYSSPLLRKALSLWIRLSIRLLYLILPTVIYLISAWTYWTIYRTLRTVLPIIFSRISPLLARLFYRTLRLLVPIIFSWLCGFTFYLCKQSLRQLACSLPFGLGRRQSDPPPPPLSFRNISLKSISHSLFVWTIKQLALTPGGYLRLYLAILRFNIKFLVWLYPLMIVYFPSMYPSSSLSALSSVSSYFTSTSSSAGTESSVRLSMLLMSVSSLFLFPVQTFASGPALLQTESCASTIIVKKQHVPLVGRRVWHPWRWCIYLWR